MAKKSELDEPAVYYIPDNFITKGTILGGTFKVRNAIEAALIVGCIAYPVMNIPMNLTAKIVIIAATCIPLGILALIGVNNGPLSQFLVDFFKFKKLSNVYKYDSTHQRLKTAANNQISEEKPEEKSKNNKKDKKKKEKGGAEI